MITVMQCKSCNVVNLFDHTHTGLKRCEYCGSTYLREGTQGPSRISRKNRNRLEELERQAAIKKAADNPQSVVVLDTEGKIVEDPAVIAQAHKVLVIDETAEVTDEQRAYGLARGTARTGRLTAELDAAKKA